MRNENVTPSGTPDSTNPKNRGIAKQKRRLSTEFVFDVKMINTLNQVSRIVQGIMYVSPAVTLEAFT